MDRELQSLYRHVFKHLFFHHCKGIYSKIILFYGYYEAKYDFMILFFMYQMFMGKFITKTKKIYLKFLSKLNVLCL